MTSRMYKYLLLVLFCSFTVGAFAQNANSSINGTVKDTHGAIVPGATVTLTNIGTNQALNTTSTTEGYYVFTNLSPANYNLAVHAPGFAEWVGVLTLRVSQAATVNATVNAASVSTQVTVRDVTPVIDSVNPTISDVKNATAIETIPVANRSILNVLAFSPGVVAGSYGGSGAGNTRINGMPPGSVDYLVDGQSMTNRNTNELQSNPQSTMTFQEVKVITAQGDAQYGSPGEVELVTKSGTNQFHGQVYELNQNNHLQARTYYSGPSIPYLQHNEYGFQLGGPVWIPKLYNGRNRTFFFFDAERIQQNANKAEQYTLPTLTQRQGNLSDVLANTTGDAITIYDPNSTGPGANGPYTRTTFSGNTIPSNRLNPVTQKIFGVIPVAGLSPVPEPNIPGAQTWNGQPNYIPAASKTTIDNTLYTAKVDQNFGPNHLAARYTYTDSKNLIPEYYAPEEPNQSENGGHNGSLTFTEVVSPHSINVAHVGVQYNNHAHSGPIQIPNVAPLLGLVPYVNNDYWPSFYFGSYAGTDAYWTGIDRGSIKDYPDQTISASDQFSYNRGSHQLLFGFEFNNFRINTADEGQPGGDFNTTGYYTAQQDSAAGVDQPVNNTGMGLADFLLGEMDQLHANYYPVYHTRQTEYDAYAQDDWRVSQRLTVNLGLRYQYWTPFSDASGLAATFNPNVAGGLMIYNGSGDLPAQVPAPVEEAWIGAGLPIKSAAAAGYPLSLFNMPKNNFEPRVGFAYQLNSKTVLRGGYGIYHFAFPLFAFEQATRHNPPFSYSATYGNGLVNGTIPNTAASELEFPNASAEYGGPQPINQFILGNQGCPTSGSPSFPAGTCNAPGFAINPTNAAASISQNNGFSVAALDPNYKASMVQEYSLTFSRELPFHTGFQLSYIGNHSSHLLMIDPINTKIPREECTTPDGMNCSDQERRMYPVFASPVNYYTYNGYANTNELQTQVTHTWGNGLTLQSYFTWMKALTTSEFGLANGGTPAGGGGGQTYTNDLIPAALTPGYTLGQIGSGSPTSDRLRAVYANDPTLPTKTFQLNAHYQLPFGKGQRFLGNAHGIVNDLVTGYNISAFFLWHSGFYFSPYFTQFASGSVGPGSRSINLAPGKTGVLPEGQRTTTRWFDASVWDPTTGPYTGQTYQLGTQLQGDYRSNIPSNYMTGPGFNNMDASVYKLTPIWKSVVLDMEAQVFNIYNHQNLGMPTSQGNITKTAGGAGANGAYPRTIQLQAKIIF